MAFSHLCFAFMTLMVTFCNAQGLHSASCRAEEISISQTQIPGTGIPKYAVQIVNTCTSDCAPSQIHVHCGQFASAEVIPKSVFTRIADDDCLVNGGEPLKSNDVISFTYFNTFSSPFLLSLPSIAEPQTVKNTF
ncbi:hypothetical protein D8674_016850 [Pyrus ussuriensis x Pyrus communis]|uniref:Uncharacterized protein n=1 Tax=Pyrus ussuriensis x Pyrus communis TaxID=2448454 RepID=A0A5N5HI71_9ROSA|nr:hypothetical protein D8674_016850 [Pyrus ussuriensis x Pyrus communis]